MEPETFWPALFCLVSRGLVICEYESTLGRLVRSFSDTLQVKLTRLFGARVVEPFYKSVQSTLENSWPDWNQGTNPDMLYGTAPYSLWAKTLKTEVTNVGTPTLTARCVEQTLDTFSSDQLNLLRNLFIF
ncbi:hypothetical protein TI04_11355 [Achromatium sp. WMS2]|nr:hypothetical protein TI04_11355 [Achromatium sp. WMS2]